MTLTPWEQRSTLRVVCPDGGTRFLIVWREMDEGRHAILAKTERAAQETLRSVIRNHGCFIEIDSYQLIDVVEPPKVFREAYRKKAFDHALAAFTTDVVSWVRDYQAVRGALPTYFEECSRFLPGPIGASPEDHYGCLNCKFGLVLKHTTWADLFEASKDAYYATAPALKHHRVERHVSRAGPATPGPVFGVFTEFGHHRQGLVVGTQVHLWHFKQDDVPILFYQRPQPLDVEPLRKLVLQARASFKREQKRQEVEYEKQSLRLREEHARHVEDILGAFVDNTSFKDL